MNRARNVLTIVLLATAATAWSQDPLEEEEDVSTLGGRVDQSFSWTDGADPAWAHTTGASFFWTPASNGFGLDEIRGDVDLLGEGFQFDSLWAVEPGAGLSWSMGRASLDLDGWMSFAELDTLSDMGAGADLSFRLLEETGLYVAATGSVSDNSGSSAGAELRWARRTDRLSASAKLSASREWDVDASAISSNLPRRLTVLGGTADQWVFGTSGSIRFLAGAFSAGPGVSASATRSELDVARSSGKGKRKSSTETTTASWALDVSQTLRAAWSKGHVDVSGLLGSTSAVALSSKSENDLFQPWGSLSFGVSW